MRRAALVLVLTFAGGGCGSCGEEHRSPVMERASHAPIKTVKAAGEAGMRRPIVVSDGVGFAGVGKRDASP